LEAAGAARLSPGEAAGLVGNLHRIDAVLEVIFPAGLAPAAGGTAGEGRGRLQGLDSEDKDVDNGTENVEIASTKQPSGGVDCGCPTSRGF